MNSDIKYLYNQIITIKDIAFARCFINHLIKYNERTYPTEEFNKAMDENRRKLENAWSEEFAEGKI